MKRSLLLYLMIVMIALFAALGVLIYLTYEPVSSVVNDRVLYAYFGVIIMNLIIAAIAVLTVYSVERRQARLLEEKNLELAATNKSKSLLLSNMSREIRTPLEGVIGMSEIALEHLYDREKVNSCLVTIAEESKHLRDFLHNLLDISKMEGGVLDLDEELIHMPDLISSLCDTARDITKIKNQKFNIEVGDIRTHYVLGDNLRIRQIFMNILTNSTKHTPEGGVLGVTVMEIAPVKDGSARFLTVCTDNGAGMSEYDQEHLFDGFSRETTGSHLGLSMLICKNLVEMMDGRLIVESRQDAGTVVTVELELPIGTPSDASDTGDLMNSRGIDFSGKRILVADDNDLSREIAAEMLIATSAEIDYAVNGKECLEKFAESPENHYSLILMDVQMPIMTGCGATVAIRALNRADSKTIPIIAMTANALPEDVREVLAAGMDSHIAKPFDFAEAAAILNKFMSKGRK